MRKISGEAGYVSGSAAHVETDNRRGIERIEGGERDADNAPGGTAQNGTTADETDEKMHYYCTTLTFSLK